jgi:hypothetical protein
VIRENKVCHARLKSVMARRYPFQADLPPDLLVRDPKPGDTMTAV